MTDKKKVTKKAEVKEEVKQEDVKTEETTPVEDVKQEETTPVEEVKTEEVKQEEVKEEKKNNRFNVGDIVFIAKGTEADLEGLKLFPQHKKYAYTVEAYDEKSGVYTLRKLNLLIYLKEADIIAPNERGDSMLLRKQF